MHDKTLCIFSGEKCKKVSNVNQLENSLQESFILKKMTMNNTLSDINVIYVVVAENEMRTANIFRPL